MKVGTQLQHHEKTSQKEMKNHKVSGDFPFVIPATKSKDDGSLYIKFVKPISV